jgi:hypothetical protein
MLRDPLNRISFLLNAALDALADITSTGFRHHALSCNNIIITGPPTRRGVVLIDFFVSAWFPESTSPEIVQFAISNGLGEELYISRFRAANGSKTNKKYEGDSTHSLAAFLRMQRFCLSRD